MIVGCFPFAKEKSYGIKIMPNFIIGQSIYLFKEEILERFGFIVLHNSSYFNPSIFSIYDEQMNKLVDYSVDKIELGRNEIEFIDKVILKPGVYWLMAIYSKTVIIHREISTLVPTRHCIIDYLLIDGLPKQLICEEIEGSPIGYYLMLSSWRNYMLNREFMIDLSFIFN